MSKFRLTILLCSLACTLAVAQKSTKLSSLAPTPPMGWNSYDCFGGNVTEAEMKENADYMAKQMKSFGWEYVVLDFLWYCDNQDSWEEFSKRRPEQYIDEYGRLIPSVKNHPSSAGGKGLKPLADYIHSKGLKFGIHIMRGMPRQAVERNTPVLGTNIGAAEIAALADTCIWYGGLVGVNMSKPGAQEYYNSLFKLYAEWEIDFIKVDDISFPYHADEIEAVHKAIENCGRDIVLSLSPGPALIGNPKHLREHASMWRVSADFWDRWDDLIKLFHLCQDWAPYVTEGHWPDADMLPLGHIQIRHETKGAEKRYTRFTKEEQYFMMTLWSIFRSPLMMGGHLPDNDAFTLSLLTNSEVIRVNQHSTNNRELSFENNISIWTADDKSNGKKYIAFLNLNDQAKTTQLPLSALDKKGEITLRNLWEKSEKQVKDRIEVTIPAHGGLMFSVE